MLTIAAPRLSRTTIGVKIDLANPPFEDWVFVCMYDIHVLCICGMKLGVIGHFLK
jgi:hypothetical protein